MMIRWTGLAPWEFEFLFQVALHLPSSWYKRLGVRDCFIFADERKRAVTRLSTGRGVRGLGYGVLEFGRVVHGSGLRGRFDGAGCTGVPRSKETTST